MLGLGQLLSAILAGWENLKLQFVKYLQFPLLIRWQPMTGVQSAAAVDQKKIWSWQENSPLIAGDLLLAHSLSRSTRSQLDRFSFAVCFSAAVLIWLGRRPPPNWQRPSLRDSDACRSSRVVAAAAAVGKSSRVGGTRRPLQQQPLSPTISSPTQAQKTVAKGSQ